MTATSGSIRFNTDSSKLEIYNGDKWWEIDSTSPQEQTGGTRGVFMGGYTSGPPTGYNQIEYVNVDSTGNATDFGDLTQQVTALMGTASSRTRGIRFGGYVVPANTNTIDYITISSTGNATDFGDVVDGDRYANAGSDSTRAVQMGEYGGNSHENTIQYVTITTTGDTKDFGDLYTGTSLSLCTCTSPTRIVLVGRQGPSNVMQYVTTQTTGNSADFGDLISNTNQCCGSNVSSATRGIIIAGGNVPDSTNLRINYITMATLGDSVMFGDISNTDSAGAGKGYCASPTRALAACGGASPAYTNFIEYVQIQTTGDSKDFGDLTVTRGYPGGLSNGHGGLS